MKTVILTFIVLSLTAGAQAGQPTIIETGQAIIVEYTGTPDSGAARAPKAAPAGSLKVESITRNIEQVQQEIDELAKRSGTETEEELARKNALADEKRAQLEALRVELAQAQAWHATAVIAFAPDDQPIPQQMRRKEMKMDLQNQRQMRRDTMTSSLHQ